MFGAGVLEPNGPSDPNTSCDSAGIPRILGLRGLAAENLVDAVEAIVEPVPVRDPADAAPVGTVDAADQVLLVLLVVRVPVVGEDEDDLAAEDGRDLVLVLEQVLAVVLAEVGVHLLRPLDHHVALDGLLAPEEREDLVGAAADGDLGGDDVELSITELLGLPGVRRVDQGLPASRAELLFEVRDRAVVAHGDPLSALLVKGLLLATTAKRKFWILPAFFFNYFQ